MVEPMEPGLREALKAEHEGLDDKILDRIEELLHRRFDVDPEEDAELIEALDRQRRELIERFAPRWGEVSARFQGRRRRPLS